MLRRLVAVLFLVVATAAPAHAAPTVLKVSGIATFDGEAKPPVGTIKLHGEKAAVTGEVSIDGDTATGTLWLDMASWDTGLGLRDEHLRSPEVFDTAKYPKAKLVLKPWKLSSAPAPIEGVLTLKDSSAPVKGTCAVDASKAAKCHLDVNLDDYPTVGKISRLGVTVDPHVSVDVTLKASP
jgi:polyisoprenoid-binding protein YceI